MLIRHAPPMSRSHLPLSRTVTIQPSPSASICLAWPRTRIDDLVHLSRSASGGLFGAESFGQRRETIPTYAWAVGARKAHDHVWMVVGVKRLRSDEKAGLHHELSQPDASPPGSLSSQDAGAWCLGPLPFMGWVKNRVSGDRRRPRRSGNAGGLTGGRRPSRRVSDRSGRS